MVVRWVRLYHKEELGTGRIGYPTLKASSDSQMREGKGPRGASRIRAGDAA